MDWLVDVDRPGALDAARSLVGGQLRRRAAEPAEAELATRIAGEALDSLARGESWVWLRLDWERPRPVLTVCGVGAPTRPFAQGSSLAEGVWAPDERLFELTGLPGGVQGAEVELPVSRPREVHVGVLTARPAPASEPEEFVASVAGTIVDQMETGASSLEAASAAGAAAAELARSLYASEHQGTEPSNAREVAEAFLAFVNAAGGDFFLAESSESRAVLVNRQCPFGSSVAGRRAMCRVTSSLLGSLGARAGGEAQVVLDEAIAAGDPRCRAVIDLEGAASNWAHQYRWPTALPVSAAEVPTRGFRIGLSLQLPRDRLSVPLIRHMVGHALREVAVVQEDIGDLELAVTEASTNVIDHAGAGDAYEVSVTVGPQLAELRVVDVGRGFDHEALAGVTVGVHDEQGRGLALMNALVDQVRLISAPERGTIVHLVKELHFDDASPVRRLMLQALEAPEGASR